jgi:hypothetical protein
MNIPKNIIILLLWVLMSHLGSADPLQAPTDLNDCILWLDATDSKTITLNQQGEVTLWTDKSSQGLKLNSPPDARPTVTPWQNGLNSLMFDPNRQTFLISNSPMKFNKSAVTFFAVIENRTQSPDDNSAFFCIQGKGNPTLWMVTRSNGELSFCTGMADETFLCHNYVKAVLQKPMLMGAWFDKSSKSKFFEAKGYPKSVKNDQNTKTPQYELDLQSDRDRIWVGCQKINAGKAPFYRSFGGNVGEIIAFSRKLNDTEYADVLNYLSQKWKLLVTFDILWFGVRNC